MPSMQSSPSASATPTPHPTPSSTATVAMTLTHLNATGLSPAVHSVTFQIAGYTLGPFALAASTPGCKAASNGGLACTLTIQAPVGQNESVSASTYATADGTGAVLENRTGSHINVIAKQTNYYGLILYGVASSIALVPQPSTVAQGQWSNLQVTVNGVDAAGETIPAPFLNPNGSGSPLTVLLTTSVGQQSIVQNLSSLDIQSPLKYVYDGIGAGPATITASATGLKSGSAALNITAGSTAAAQIFTGTVNGSAGNQFSSVAQFGATASGNVSPIRNIIPGSSSSAAYPYGVDTSGNFWAGSTRYSARGVTLGTLNIANSSNSYTADSSQNFYAVTNTAQGSIYCPTGGTVYINEYAAGSYGTPSPLRQIQVGTICEAGPMAIDGAGDVFFAENVNNVSGSNPATIVEYGPTGSGQLTPTRTIMVSAPAGTNTIVSSMATDAAGNLYVLVSGSLEEFAVKSTSPQSVLPGVDVASFALDSQANIYTEVGTGSTFAIEEFPAGSTVPARQITGSNTELAAPGGIGVTP